MRRRLAILCLVGAATSACGTLLAAADDDELSGGRDGGAGDGSSNGDATPADGSPASDAVATTDAADAADATPSKSDIFRAAVMSDGPIAYWRFGEAVGATTFLSETQTNPATAGGGIRAPAIVDPGLFGAGSHALAFKGTTGMNASCATLPFLANNFSVEAWVFPGLAPDGNFRHLFQHSNGSVSYGIYLLATEGIVIERIAGGNKTQLQTNAAPLPGMWHHIVATRDAALHLYVDGIEIMIGGSFVTSPAPSGSFFLGAKDDGAPSLPSDTHVAEVAVYDKAISATRVAVHSTLGKN